jgi:ribosomal protein L24
MITQTTKNSNMAQLKAGHHVYIHGGKYNGKKGTILKINKVRHQVEIDHVSIGWITRTSCTPIHEVLQPDNQNLSRLFSAQSPAP